MTDSVRVRFAPSPTGPLHIGGARTALFNWLFARHHGGTFILRLEDTDQKRFDEEAINLITDGLEWIGIDWDEGPHKGGDYGPYIQSQRVEMYQEWADWLVENDKAYRCYCTPERLEEVRQAATKEGRVQGYDRRCRNLSEEERQQLHDETNGTYVIRFKMPLDGNTTITDMIRGNITVENKELNDFVLLKSDGFPTYHLANVVDDHFMEISHIIRAEEWISTAPIHKQLYMAFGWDMPEIAHVPVILNPGGKGKLSKRSAKSEYNGMTVPILVHEYEDEGFVPDAVRNFLTNTGWHMPDDREVFTSEEAIEAFDISKMSAAGTTFDIDKLNWINGVYLRDMDPVKLAQLLKPMLEEKGFEVNGDVLVKITPHIQERLKRLPDAIPFTEFLWKEDFEPVETEKLVAKKMTAQETADMLKSAKTALEATDDFSSENLETLLRGLVKELEVKGGQLFGTLRWATIAQQVSPPLFPSMEVIGKDACVERTQIAIDLLEAHES